MLHNRNAIKKRGFIIRINAQENWKQREQTKNLRPRFLIMILGGFEEILVAKNVEREVDKIQ